MLKISGRLVMLLLTMALFFWQYESYQKIQESKRVSIQKGLNKIKQRIEENSTCYNLIKETNLNRGQQLWIIKSDTSGLVDTIHGYTAVMGDRKKNFGHQPISFQTRSKVDVNLRVEYLKSEKDVDRTDFQVWIDSLSQNALVDSSNGISFGDTNQISVIVKEELPLWKGKTVSWEIKNQQGQRLFLSGKGNLGNGKMEQIILYNKLLLENAEPYLLYIYSPVESSLTSFLWRWELLIPLAIFFLSLLLLITLERASKRELKLAETQRNILNHVSHEFNTQISKILMSVESLQQADLEGRKQQEYLTILERGARKLKDNLKSYLNANNADQGTYADNKEDFSLLSLFDEIVADIQNTIELNISCSPTLCLYANRVHFKQVFQNLIENAHKYGGQKLEINAEENKTSTVIRVKDNGLGVPDDCLERVFDPYFRINEKTADGFGLGLSYCKSVIDAHGGSIKAINLKRPSAFELKISLNKS